MSNRARGTAIVAIASDFRELWHSDYSRQAEFRIYSPDGDSRFGRWGRRNGFGSDLALVLARVCRSRGNADDCRCQLRSGGSACQVQARPSPSTRDSRPQLSSALCRHRGRRQIGLALQNPTKLGLKANQTINVEDAIKGLVTKSANDAAVVVAEAIGGSEEEFAKLMTLKAAALGMTGTTYVNASGLPAEAQITTARDQAVLGRAIQHRFPLYYQYFATPSFRYKGAEMRNHNNLLGRVKGVDGIKTGYTEASGYNLTSSVRRDEKHIVAVVLGGTSNGARDARMRQLIEAHISHASTQRTTPIIVEANGQATAHQDNARQDGAHVVAVARAIPNAEPPADERSDAAVASAKADPVPVPRPRLQAAKLRAGASKRVAGAQAPATRAQRTTAKASTLGVLQDISTLRQTRHVERKIGSSAPLQ